MAVTNQIEAKQHKHWLLQVFVSSQSELNITIQEQRIYCHALIINMNTVHCCDTAGEPYFTMLVDPTMDLGKRLRRLLADQSYYIIPDQEARNMQAKLHYAIQQNSTEAIIAFAQSIFMVDDYAQAFDQRIELVLTLLDDCLHEEEHHQIAYFAKQTGLSNSRLAHLFKEETGIPLKSYIVLHKLQKAYDYVFQGATLTDAALHAGFDSSSHLAYTNKRMTGMAANDIRKDSEFLKVI